jgi:hypothetical protein
MSESLKSIDRLKKIGDQTFYIVPIAEVFAQLAKGDELDVTAITQARNALIDLKNYLLQGLDNLKGTFNTAFKEHTDVFEKLTNEINTLKNLTIPQTQRDIQGNADGQIEKQTQLDDARNNLQWTTSQLNKENSSWDMRVQLNTLLMPQFDSEYAIVVQAEAIIKNAQKNGQV